MASLFVIRGNDAGKHYSLDSDLLNLGRDAICQIVLNDQEVSRQHAAIQRDGDGLILTDLSSSNGTFVNGQKIERHLLRPGDRLQIGRSLLVFTAREESPDTASHINVQIVADSDATPTSENELSQIRRAVPGMEGDQASFNRLSKFGVQDLEASSSNVSADSRVTDPEATTSAWDVLYRAILAVSRTLDIDQLLDQLLDFVFEGVACDRGCILLMDDGTQRLKPVVNRYRKTHQTKAKLEISQTILDYVVRNREGVLTSNARDDQRWEAGGSIVGMGIREAICVPMLGRYGLVGAIYIDTSQSPGEFIESQGKLRFNEEQLQLMVAIGYQAALAIEDTFYYRGMVQAERLAAMGQTIATLSHHIKNILQGIQGGSYLVHEGIRRNQLETIAKGWKIVEKNQDRISGLVLDMLTFSKERVPTYATVDLVAVIDDCLELTEPRAKELGITVHWTQPETFPPVTADADAIHRAILNVVNNAIDAMKDVENPTLDVVLRYEDPYAILDVHDNGTGIDADEQAKIFSLFESTKGSRGTGLGLPVSQKILREHGGDIRVQSELGRGSCFSLLLPLHPPSTLLSESLDRPTDSGDFN